MKMLVYALQEEERGTFERFAAQYGVELTMTNEKPSPDNTALARGMDAINVLSDVPITDEMWLAYKAAGVRVGVTRTIGKEHMNETFAEKLGIRVLNITYSPASVADYAIMLMLMVLRHVKTLMLRYAGQDYTSRAVLGRELPNLTVGILGAGRIGCTVAKHLGGFGCRVLYWNRSPKPEMEGLAVYAELDTLLRESDIVTLHLASNEQTRYFMNRERLAQMKPGSVLINTGRGALVDSEALIEALEEGRLAGAGLDCVDGDRAIYYRDFKNVPVLPRSMAVLNAMPNVVMLPHMAYYTDQAAEDMVRNSLAVTKVYLEETANTN